MSDTFHYYRSSRGRSFNTSPGRSWDGTMTAEEHAVRAARGRDRPATCFYCDDESMLAWKTERETSWERAEFRLALCPRCGWWAAVKDRECIYDPNFDSPVGIYSYKDRTDQWFAILETCSDTGGAAALAELGETLGENRPGGPELPARGTQALVRQVLAGATACDVHYYDDAAATAAGIADLIVILTDSAPIAFLLTRRPAESRERLRRVRDFMGPAGAAPFSAGIYVTTSGCDAPAAAEPDAAGPHTSGRASMLAVVDGERLRDLLMLHRPSERSLKALASIIPDRDWRCPELDLRDQDIPGVLELTRRSRCPR